MKTLSTLLTALFMLSLCALQAQTYVHASATGNNDGSSWADAYTDLNTAIANAPADGEIWVAAGTYLPSGSSARSATFFINKNLRLYGGFAGTETQLSERNPESNLSLLSGDVNGDDRVSNDSLLNRDDNVFHIMQIGTLPDSTSLIDGFTFTGGYADGLTQDDRRGGAIHTQSEMQIRHCVFRENYSDNRGGALYANGSETAGLRVTNCTFEKNLSNNRAGALSFVRVPRYRVDSCDFVENRSQQAAGTTSALAGAARTLNSSGTFFRNVFHKNTALRTGGALVLTFNDNASLGCTISQCVFTENQASFSGGLQITANGDNAIILVEDCEFTANRSTNLLGFSEGSGGGIGIFHSENTNASGNQIQIQACTLENNSTLYKGGGIFYDNLDGQGNSLSIDGCEFVENTADFAGGAVLISTPNDDNTVSIDRSTFENNYSLNGMAISVTRETPAGISLDQQCSLRNCLFTAHDAPMEVAAVIGNFFSNIDLVNCTLANNESIAFAVQGSGAFSLQNNILFNPGYSEYTGLSLINPMAADIVSAGGNLVRDTSLNAWLMPNQDLPSADPLFEANSYQLSSNSPAIDLGQTYPGFDSTDVDLAGNARLQGSNVDAGAYESPVSATAIQDLIVPHASLRMYPIPVSSLTTLDLDNAWRGQLGLRVFNLQGQVVLEQHLQKLQDQASWSLDLSRLAPGSYRLLMTHGQEAAVKSFIKK
jgi:predicted outer membrane repeat protein